jgi:response regulator RpfG family c-di-GMP phosphodiesterase
MDTARPLPASHCASSVLLVDDEPGVLAALRRVLRARGFEVLCASGGQEALKVLERERIDAIITDMRMPGMSGAEFLKASLALAPDAVRVLLTGYADVGSAAQAINDGEVFRYVTKPWDDAALMQSLREGLARRALDRERDASCAAAEERAEHLRAINVDLAAQVAVRTGELAAVLGDRQGLSRTVRLLSSLAAQRAGLTAPCPRRVVRRVRSLGPSFGVAGPALRDLTFAALLQDIGKLSLPDTLVRQPLDALGPDDRQQVLGHPLAGEASLQALPLLQDAGAILGRINENYDGGGVPGACRGHDIPLAARLLRVLTDYEHYLAGAIDLEALTPQQACGRLRQHRGTRYDPMVVDGFLHAMHQPLAGRARKALIASDGLRPGLVLAQDLVSRSGSLLLGQGCELTPALIVHLRRLEADSGEFLWIEVTRDEGCERGVTVP